MGVEFYHVFQTSERSYLYDVNTDQIIIISDGLYDYLKSVEDKKVDEYLHNEKILGELERLKERGYLKTNHVKKHKHPMTDYVEDALKSKLTCMILQVTQNCNFRCEYCLFSGSYKNREHSNKRMSFEMAQKGIDFFVDNSKESQTLHLAFYGGEPLLEYKLIKKCIEYIESKVKHKEIVYNLTTNLSLINEEMICFFQEKNLFLTVSLDGPKEIQDQGRRFAEGTASTFDVVIKKLEHIKKVAPEYFEKNVSFNTVINNRNSFLIINDFFKNNPLIANKSCMYSLVSREYSLNGMSEVNKNFTKELKYEYFKCMLAKLERYPEDSISKFLKVNLLSTFDLRENRKHSNVKQIPDCYHHGGPCIPGCYRLFMNVDGQFFPCERVSECSKLSCIGSIEEGFDIQQVKKILNTESVTSEECTNCWAYYYCDVCVRKADDLDDLSREKILSGCEERRYNLENQFKDYCVLSELLKKHFD